MGIYILALKTGLSVLAISLLGAAALYGVLSLIKQLIIKLTKKENKKVRRLENKPDIDFNKLKRDMEHWQQIIEN